MFRAKTNEQPEIPHQTTGIMREILQKTTLGTDPQESVPCPIMTMEINDKTRNHTPRNRS